MQCVPKKLHVTIHVEEHYYVSISAKENVIKKLDAGKIFSSEEVDLIKLTSLK